MRFDALTTHLTNTTALRILPKLPLLLSSTEALRVDQRALGGLLKVSQPSISRGLSALIDVGAIVREGRGPGSRYRLSREVDWPGVEPASFHNTPWAGVSDPIRSTPPPPPARSVPAPPRTPDAARAEVNGLVAARAVAVAGRDALLALPEHQRSAGQVSKALALVDRLDAEVLVAKRRLRTLQRAALRERRAAV